MMQGEPCTPLFAYYGDDFTGSTDALEALALHGIPSVLFLEIPDEECRNHFRHCRAFGLAGESRSRSPEWMSAQLPGIFRALKAFGAPIHQYKVCSTFDSSPDVGSIGRALEIGKDVFRSETVPVVAAAPRLKRYVLFSNLFAAAGEHVYRIDRHPTMSCHPSTPMSESDLRRHLARQTNAELAAIDILALNSEDAASQYTELLRNRASGVIFDGFTENSVAHSAGLIWQTRARTPFVVGSSGFTHGLADYWQATESIPPPAPPGTAQMVDRIVVIAGSCSPVTERQIRSALAAGFAGYRISVPDITDGKSSDVTSRDLIHNALNSLRSGKSVIFYTALGPTDCNQITSSEHLGMRLGLMLREILIKSGVRRAVIAGGDTSSYAGRQLGVYALTLLAPLAPGTPLCEAYSHDPRLSGLQLVLKGGQVGGDNFFTSVLQGRC